MTLLCTAAYRGFLEVYTTFYSTSDPSWIFVGLLQPLRRSAFQLALTVPPTGSQLTTDCVT